MTLIGVFAWVQNLASQIPDVIWAGVIASLITLSGVWLSNRSNMKQLLHQLSHDAREKEIERTVVMRRDVYLNAVEQMSKIAGQFGQLSQLDPVKDKLDSGLKEFLSASAKAQLVSNSETSRLIGELSTRIGEIYLTLLVKVQPIFNLNIDIGIANTFCEKYQTEINRTLSGMKQINESGVPDTAKFDALNRALQNAQSLFSEYAEERNELYIKRNAELKSFTITLMKEMQSVGKIQLLVTVAIRQELNLESDISDYEARLQETYERMDKKVKELLETLESE